MIVERGKGRKKNVAISRLEGLVFCRCHRCLLLLYCCGMSLNTLTTPGHTGKGKRKQEIYEHSAHNRVLAHIR